MVRAGSRKPRSQNQAVGQGGAVLPRNCRNCVPHPGSLFPVLDRAYRAAVDRRGHGFRPIPRVGSHGSRRKHDNLEALAKLCWIGSPIPRKARVLERLATISGWRGGLSRLPRNRIGELGSVSDLSLAYGHRPPVSPLWGAPSGGWGASPFELRSAGAAAG